MTSSRGAGSGRTRGEVDALLIDGNNLLHRVSGSADPGALRLLLARLRAALPSDVATSVILDGHPAAGTSRTQRVTRQLEIRHSGSISADDLIVLLVRDHPDRARMTVVSDDRSLIERARSLGARTQRLAWLEQLMAGRPIGATGAQPGIGGGRPPVAPGQAAARGPADANPDEEREPWKPGRGATRKRGNPRRRRA